jgi:hypothetical protein
MAAAFAELIISGQRTPWKSEWSFPTAPAKMQAADRVSGEHAWPARFVDSGKHGGQLLDATPEPIDIVLHGQNAADALELISPSTSCRARTT